MDIGVLCPDPFEVRPPSKWSVHSFFPTWIKRTGRRGRKTITLGFVVLLFLSPSAYFNVELVRVLSAGLIVKLLLWKSKCLTNEDKIRTIYIYLEQKQSKVKSSKNKYLNCTI